MKVTQNKKNNASGVGGGGRRSAKYINQKPVRP